jgi:hypothetical protein
VSCLPGHDRNHLPGLIFLWKWQYPTSRSTCGFSPPWSLDPSFQTAASSCRLLSSQPHYYQLVIVAAQVLFTPANSTLVTVILLATLLASAPGRRARDCTLGGVESGPAQIYLTELDWNDWQLGLGFVICSREFLSNRRYRNRGRNVEVTAPSLFVWQLRRTADR